MPLPAPTTPVYLWKTPYTWQPNDPQSSSTPVTITLTAFADTAAQALAFHRVQVTFLENQNPGTFGTPVNTPFVDFPWEGETGF